MVVDVTGHPGGECFLIITEKCAVLCDTGFAFSADAALKNIRAAIGEKPLSAILLTHSHYDHVLGCNHILSCYPAAKIICSEYASNVFSRNGAVSQMKAMDGKKALDSSFPPLFFGAPHPDIILKDSEEISFEGVTICGVATPGHTNCSMSFYFPNDGLLALSESMGSSTCYPEIRPGFIVSYQDSLDSIEKIKAIGANRMILPHWGMVNQTQGSAFLKEAREITMQTVQFILSHYEQGESVEEIVMTYKDAYYSEARALKQPEQAFIWNTRAMVERIVNKSPAHDGLQVR